MNRLKFVSVEPGTHQVRNLNTLLKIELEKEKGWLGANTWTVVSYWNIGNPADDRVVHYRSLDADDKSKVEALAVYHEVTRVLSGSRPLCLKNYHPEPKKEEQVREETKAIEESKDDGDTTIDDAPDTVGKVAE